MSLTDRVESALDTIRPYLLTDGGNVSIEEITPENVVRLRLLGSCGSCPMSIMTLKAGIEEAIKKAVPEITSVEAVNLTAIDDSEAVLPSKYAVIFSEVFLNLKTFRAIIFYHLF